MQRSPGFDRTSYAGSAHLLGSPAEEVQTLIKEIMSQPKEINDSVRSFLEIS
jgi:hypothetical protein